MTPSSLFSTATSSRQIVVNEHMLKLMVVEPQGDVARTIVFLHGWRSQADVWGRVISALDDGSTRMIAVNLPGFGGSQMPTRPFSVRDYVDMVAGLLQKLELSGTTVVGHSFGGSVATMLAVTYPELVTRLVLVGSAGLREQTPKLKAKKRLAHLLRPLFTPAFMQPLRRAIYRMIGAEDAVATPELTQTFRNIIEEDISPRWSEVTQPTLLIWGRNDHETPLSFGEAMQERIPGAELMTFDDAGHFVFVDAHTQFVEAVEAFVKG